MKPETKGKIIAILIFLALLSLLLFGILLDAILGFPSMQPHEPGTPWPPLAPWFP